MEQHFLPRIRVFYGFSLFQLLIVLTIISILTISSVPTFIELYQKYHLKTTAQNLYYVLQYAKSESIKNNSSIYVDFQTGDNWCYGVNSGSTCNCNTINSCSLGRYATSQTEDLDLSLSGVSNHTIQFEGTHGAVTSSAIVTFTIHGQTNALGIKVNRLGSLLLCSSTLSGYPSCS